MERLRIYFQKTINDCTKCLETAVNVYLIIFPESPKNDKF